MWPAPPDDYGSDRYDYIEVDAPVGMTVPPELVSDPACMDCRANVFLRSDGDRWHRKVAHDDGCPTLARIENER